MTRVLIPFADPEGARRAVEALLREPRSASLHVHLLAAVEPRTGGKVAIYLTRGRAEAMALDAARRWLAPIEAMLAAAGVAHSSEVVLGAPRVAIRAAADRPDIDRVVLPPAGDRWLARREWTLIRERSPHPVTLVA